MLVVLVLARWARHWPSEKAAALQVAPPSPKASGPAVLVVLVLARWAQPLAFGEGRGTPGSPAFSEGEWPRRAGCACAGPLGPATGLRRRLRYQVAPPSPKASGPVVLVMRAGPLGPATGLRRRPRYQVAPPSPTCPA